MAWYKPTKFTAILKFENSTIFNKNARASFAYVFLSADFEFLVQIFAEYFSESQLKEAGSNIAMFQKTK